MTYTIWHTVPTATSSSSISGWSCAAEASCSRCWSRSAPSGTGTRSGRSLPTRGWKSTRGRSIHSCAAWRVRESCRASGGRRTSGASASTGCPPSGSRSRDSCWPNGKASTAHSTGFSRRHVMDLVERYLQAVKVWLPAKQRADIIAELAEDIRSEIEEKESGLGRKLDQAEVEALLQRRGRPIVAAGRFRPQRSLIGPALFPIYATVLRILAIPYLMMWTVRSIYLFVTSPSVRAESPVAWVTHAGSAFWSPALLLFGGVTLLF